MLHNIYASNNKTLIIKDPKDWNSIIEHQAKLKNDKAILHTLTQMQSLQISPNPKTLPLILKACSKLQAIETGKWVHSYVKDHEFVDDVRIRTALVDFYGKCGLIEDARNVFDEMPQRDIVLWNAMINGYVGGCCFEEGLWLFKEIWEEKLKPTAVTLVMLLVACGELLELRLGKEVHGYCLRNGLFDSSYYIRSALIGFYARFDVRISRVVFDLMGMKNVVCWNAMINGYSSVGDQCEALKLFVEMLVEGMKCDNVTLLGAIQACSEIWNRELGKQLHQLAIKYGYGQDLRVVNALLTLYGRTCLESSFSLFDYAPMRDTAVWNSLISAYSECGRHEEACRVFSMMQSEGFRVNEATITIMLSVCSDVGSEARVGKSLHSKVIKSGFHSNASIINTVLKYYAGLGCVSEAMMLFSEIVEPDILSWNIIIAAVAGNGLRKYAWNYLEKMLDSETRLNSHTIVAILPICNDVSYLNVGRSLHAYVLKHGIEVNVELNTALVEVYLNCADEGSARSLFERCSNRDVVSWNSLIANYVKNNLAHEALPLFSQMISEVEPNSVTMINILSSCTDMASLPIGQCLYAYIIRRNYFGSLNLSLENALLSMYARCGSMQNAEKIFETIQRRNISSWNALVAGYGLNGQVSEALQAVTQMLDEGYRPNGRTLLSILSACGHSGMLEKGLELFTTMVSNFKITPKLVHYASIVDLLGRAGYIYEAEKIIKSMPFEPDASVWRALLSACRAKPRLAKSIFERLLEVEPTYVGNYILLSNIYASSGLWSEVRELRMHIKEKGLRKNPGMSWIFVRNQVYCFIAGSQTCYKADEIYATLNSLFSTLKEDRYTLNILIGEEDAI